MQGLRQNIHRGRAVAWHDRRRTRVGLATNRRRGYSMALQQIQGQDMSELEKENQRLRELIEQLKADLKTALQAYRDVVSKM